MDILDELLGHADENTVYARAYQEIKNLRERVINVPENVDQLTNAAYQEALNLAHTIVLEHADHYYIQASKVDSLVSETGLVQASVALGRAAKKIQGLMK